MQLKISEKANRNYLAKIVKIRTLREHPNADKLLITTIDGNDVITAKGGIKEGDLVVYFPLECAICSLFLTSTNSYRHSEKNIDTTKVGFFEDTGRVRAVKLRGQKSEGYIVPIEELAKTFNCDIEDLKNAEDQEFDTINKVVLVKKYVIKNTEGTSGSKQAKGAKGKMIESKLIDNQFKFHGDTSQLGKNLHLLNPESNITITWKMHGTSFVSSNLLVKRKLNWFEKALKALGVNINSTEYGNIYSSRKVIKNPELTLNPNSYYKSDIWGQVNENLKNSLLKGETIYGEITGYTESGEQIQKDYDYGAQPNEHKVYVYRITYTNIDGHVIELDYQQMAQRCTQLGIEPVPHIFTGLAKTYLKPALDEDLRDWRDLFLTQLKTDFVHDQKSKFCLNDVPEEGIVLRINGVKPEAFKLKAFAFLERESKSLDKGEVSMEDIESQSE